MRNLLLRMDDVAYLLRGLALQNKLQKNTTQQAMAVLAWKVRP